jgi:hypothetical protein
LSALESEGKPSHSKRGRVIVSGTLRVPFASGMEGREKKLADQKQAEADFGLAV